MNILELIAKLSEIAVEHPNISVYGDFTDEDFYYDVHYVIESENEEYVWIH